MNGSVLHRLAGRWRLSLLLAASSSGFGCKVQPDAAEAAEAYLDLRGSTLCTMGFRCCDASRQQSPSQAECEKRGALHTGFQQLTDAVANGTTKIDMAQAERCFSEVRAMSCSAWSAALAGAVPASCSGIFSGKASGQSCSNDAECTSQFCDRTSGDHTILVPQRSGVCAVPAGPSGSCPADQNGCLPGSRCLGPNGVPSCTAYPATGAACSKNTDCVSETCAAGTCAPACWGAPNSHHLLGTPSR